MVRLEAWGLVRSLPALPLGQGDEQWPGTLLEGAPHGRFVQIHGGMKDRLKLEESTKGERGHGCHSRCQAMVTSTPTPVITKGIFIHSLSLRSDPAVLRADSCLYAHEAILVVLIQENYRGVSGIETGLAQCKVNVPWFSRGESRFT